MSEKPKLTLMTGISSVSKSFRALLLTITGLVFTINAGATTVSDSLPAPFTTAIRSTNAAFMCDVCGCSGNGGSMGYGTGLDKNFAGLRYISQRYRSRDGIFNNSPWVDENFNTLQAWGRIPVGKRVVIHAMIPYHFHHRTFADKSEQDLNGMGDMTLLGFYRLIKPSDSTGSATEFRHTLHVGGGIKLPTGKFDKANNEGSVNPSFQAGTGSWDYIIAADYGIILQNWGAGAMINYTFKTENSDHYHFGDQLNYGIHAYRPFALSDSFALTPLVGVAGEVFGENEQYGQPVADTRGDVFFGKWGLETAYKKWSLGITGMIPITQNLNNGKVVVKNRFSVYVNFNI
ncbi:transporter [Sinomicrobium kalidii]|uniref:transporter n=1 Tax=Sinomicrobium kalidii TaxID=2900738 RepID=UPI001E33D715|nr:transporter [Sinomicrobium kalidii]UGU16932.1 transporter [Sinomicrobium kalidii]